MNDWVACIGLEIHIQLATASKLFCACPNEFGAAPNTLTCPVCTGQPGALPVPNRGAFELAVRLALALGCRIAPESSFDRKQYFYPDLPKGYQITQSRQPFASGGGLPVGAGQRVALARVHLEEDSGRSVHDGAVTRVDLNRAGIPLVEIVTAPEIQTAAAARLALEHAREVACWIGASTGRMQQGALRCDVNVSVRPRGAGPRTRVEVKNLNSLRHVTGAIEHEIRRQIELWESGRNVAAETRAWDPRAGRTYARRRKEESADYRILPDPDLSPCEASPAWIEAQRAFLPELPDARRRRYVETLGLSRELARVLTRDRALSDFFESAARHSGRPLEAARWLAGDVRAALRERGQSVDDLRLRPHDLADLIALVERGRATRPAARRVLEHMLAHDVCASAALEALGLAASTDPARHEEWCRAAIAADPESANAVRAGRARALERLVGAVLASSAGRADPVLARTWLERILELEP